MAGTVEFIQKITYVEIPDEKGEQTMPDRNKVIFDIERCICHVPDACRDCSHYGHGEVIGCMEELLADALELIKSSKLIHTEHAWYTVCEGRR